MNRTEKLALAEQMRDQFSRAKVALFADFKGLGAREADQLRHLLRGHDAEVKVLKNNVARLALGEAQLGAQTQSLINATIGPTLVAFAYGDPTVAAKVFFKFAQDHQALRIKESLMGTKRLEAADVEALAKLPSREVLLAQLLRALNGPAASLVGVLAAVPRSLVQVLAAIQKARDSDSQTSSVEGTPSAS